MLWDWMMGAYAAAVNVGGAFFLALVLGYYSNRRKLRLLREGRPVNKPPPPPPPQTVEDAWFYSTKPLDTDIYPQIEADPELDELIAKIQVRKEKRKARKAEKEAVLGAGDADAAKDRKARAQKKADEAEKRREAAAAAAAKADKAKP